MPLEKKDVREGMDDQAFLVYAEIPDHLVTRAHPVVVWRDLAPMDP